MQAIALITIIYCLSNQDAIMNNLDKKIRENVQKYDKTTIKKQPTLLTRSMLEQYIHKKSGTSIYMNKNLNVPSYELENKQYPM
jgi:hypothetical protein